MLNEKNHLNIEKTKRYMMDMLIMLMALSVMSVFLFGKRALTMILFSLFCGAAIEALIYLIFLREIPKRLADLSTIVTSLIVVLALPANAPFWLIFIGILIAVGVAKIPFGNAEDSPFVPASVALSFLAIGYTKLFFNYPSFLLTKFDDENIFVSGFSIAKMLSQNKSMSTDFFSIINVIIGRVDGPMGAVSVIVLMGCLFYLFIRRRGQFKTAIAYISTCALLSVIFPRVLTGRIVSLFMELSSGLLLFAGIFLISDLITSPHSPMGRTLYGIFAGMLTMMFRYFGAYEEGVFFVVIIMNSMSPVVDNMGLKLTDYISENKNKSKIMKKLAEKRQKEVISIDKE